jgi:hypothetical protein
VPLRSLVSARLRLVTQDTREPIGQSHTQSLEPDSAATRPSESTPAAALVTAGLVQRRASRPATRSDRPTAKRRGAFTWPRTGATVVHGHKPRPCRYCGVEVIYLELIGRTVQLAAVPYMDGMPGVIYDRHRGQLRLCTDVTPAPRQHNPIHFCEEY